MKKLFGVLIALAMALSLAACGEELVDENVNQYIDAIIISDYETWCFVRITNAYDSGLEAADFISVSKDVVSAGGCPELEYNDIVRIVFNGDITLPYPTDVLELPAVFAIYKDKAGIPDLEYFARGGEVPSDSLNGRTRGEITEEWGEPDRQDGSNVFYDLGGESGISVSIIYDGDKASGVWTDSTDVTTPADDVSEPVSVGNVEEEYASLEERYIHFDATEITVSLRGGSLDEDRFGTYSGDEAKLIINWISGLRLRLVSEEEIESSEGGYTWWFSYPEYDDGFGILYGKYIAGDGAWYEITNMDDMPIVLEEIPSAAPDF